MPTFKVSILSGAILLAACGEQATEPQSAPATFATAPEPVSCESLATSEFANTTIASAETVAAGAFNPPAAGGFPGFGPDWSSLPSFCRVIGSIHPTADSDIRFELWLPTENWNGKFMQTGNGGAAGSIVTSSLVDPLKNGYAVANTDTGHQATGSDIFAWGVDHPEKVTDFAWRAVHELTTTGKAITSTRYGSDPELSYFVGCSTGGRQGLMEAQRFPEDYDGIVAGSPANNWSPLMALSIVIQTNLGPGKLPLGKIPLLKQAALDSCDALDGVEDSVITNIAQCDFNPASIQCSAGDSDQCLNDNEVEAARKIYAGVVDSSGRTWFPGTGPASEQLWAGYTSPQFTIGADYFQELVFNGQDWDPASFNADTDMPPAMEAASDIIAMDPDLSAYIEKGGKLISYHGTADGLISYGNSVNYFNSVLDTLSEEAVNEGARFYIVPGMSHCAGGEGASQVDWVGAMESWVESGEAPQTLLGTHPAPPPGAPGGGDVFTRPTCVYPQMPVYNGSGDTSVAESFSCAVPE